MAFKLVIFAAVLAYANAGNLYAAPAAYSAAPAVSSSYLHQAAPVAYAAPAQVAYAAPAPVAVAHAAPVAYAAPAQVAYAAPAQVAIHAPAYGASQQSVVRSLGGNQAVSHYSKAVDSAFSSVRKFDTRFTNDALTVSHAPVAYAAHAAPVAYAAPAQYAYAAQAAPVAYAAHAAPVAYGAPIAHAAPVIAKTAAVAYSPATVVSHATFTGLGAHYAW